MNPITFLLTRVRARRAERQRNGAIVGLLTAVHWQVQLGLFTVKLEQHTFEPDEAHASRELVAGNEHARSSLITIGLFIRNELSGRGLLHLIDGDQAPVEPTATMKRTVAEKPE